MLSSGMWQDVGLMKTDVSEERVIVSFTDNLFRHAACAGC
jgi:hypothetical protein